MQLLQWRKNFGYVLVLLMKLLHQCQVSRHIYYGGELFNSYHPLLADTRAHEVADAHTEVDSADRAFLEVCSHKKRSLRSSNSG